MNEKKTYHQSGLGKFEFCGWAYYLEEIEGKRGLGNWFSCRGNGTHKARKLNLRQKVKTRKDLPLPLMLDAARDEVNRLINSDYIDLRSRDLEGLSKKIAAGRIIDTTIKMVEVDRELLQRHLQPVEVEVERKIVLAAWPFDLGMRFDSVDIHRFINDLKTAKMKWTQEKSDSDYQPSVYWLGWRAEHNGQDPAGFQHHCVICTSKKHRVSAYIINTQRTDAQILAVLERFSAMHQAIEAGIFTPCHQSSWKCSRDWCEFYYCCKFIGRTR